MLNAAIGPRDDVPTSRTIAGITETVGVGVGLVRVRSVQAIVIHVEPTVTVVVVIARVPEAVAIEVAIVDCRRRVQERAEIAPVRDAVVVVVGIARIAEAVAVVVALVGVPDRCAIVARVADEIAVAVGLRRVRHEGARVAPVGIAILIRVEHRDRGQARQRRGERRVPAEGDVDQAGLVLRDIDDARVGADRARECEVGGAELSARGADRGEGKRVVTIRGERVVEQRL